MKITIPKTNFQWPQVRLPHWLYNLLEYFLRPLFFIFLFIAGLGLIFLGTVAACCGAANHSIALSILLGLFGVSAGIAYINFWIETFE
jgi:hypothetical protein